MKKININSIVSSLNMIRYSGKEDFDISELIDLLNNTPISENQLFWCDERNVSKLESLKGGSVILSEKSFSLIKNDHLNYIIVEKPRTAFKHILEKFFATSLKSHYISPTAKIDESVVFNPDIYIGDNVVIENGCQFGKNVFIGHNTIIHSNTLVSDNVKIGCNNTIGSTGFGYERNEDGEWEVIPHIGNVIIHDNVEIGNNNCIDRAVLGSTVIGKHVKIDNLVHIAHGVKIGNNSLIIANAMIGGSAVIGENVWVGPSASIINKGLIKNNGFIGMSAVVIKPVEENSIVAGNPAKHLRHNVAK